MPTQFYKSISATCLCVEYCSGSLEHHKHWFCPNDLKCCVGGTIKKIAIVGLIIPTIWPIQEDTNLTQKEVTILEKAGFSFDRMHRNNA
jgi:hypothetical protein